MLINSSVVAATRSRAYGMAAGIGMSAFGLAAIAGARKAPTATAQGDQCAWSPPV